MIYEFKNENSFLSNFYITPVEYNGLIYKSSEHAYMRMKSNEDWWIEYCLNEKSPGKIKRTSNGLLLADNWHDIKANIMYDILICKFKNTILKEKLLATGNQNLVEGNYHNDLYYGVDLKQTPNIGENMLGRILMSIRNKIKKEKNK